MKHDAPATDPGTTRLQWEPPVLRSLAVAASEAGNVPSALETFSSGGTRFSPGSTPS